MRLRAADLEGVLSFLVDVSDMDLAEPYPVDALARLQELVPCDDLTYQLCDVPARRFDAMVELVAVDDEVDEAAYWAAFPCPLTEYRLRTSDLAAMRMSDVISPRRYHELPIYREYFRPGRIDHMLDLGLPARRWEHRSFVLMREVGARDFSDRDRAVLDVLQPHLPVLEERAFLRRQLSELTLSMDVDRVGTAAGLTAREQEVVRLVAEGKTNAEIAAALWVAPSTVKKHLEHIYEKLGVGRRAAAASMLQARAQPSPEPSVTLRA